MNISFSRTSIRPLRLGLFFLGAVIARPEPNEVGNGPALDASALGFSVERLGRIHDLISRRIETKKLPGAIAVVSRNGQLAYGEALGWSDVESRQPLRRDALFRMASMSKPVTGVGILILVEDGKLRLTDPVSLFIPEFHGMKVAMPASVSAEPTAGGAGFSTVAARREITIRDLLTHTSGLGSGPISDGEIKKIKRQPGETLATFIPKLGATPLEFQPGTRWFYSGMAGFDTLGRIIEIASGETLEQFLRHRLFLPLGMTNTTFHPTDEQRRRLATLYLLEPEGIVRAKDQSDPIREFYSAGASGLVSSADDYLRFATMLAGTGEFNEVRILSPRMVQLMGSEQVSDTMPGRSFGEAWGLSVRVITGGAGNGTLLSAGSFGWSGSMATHFWVDPKEKMAAVFLTQVGKSGGSGAETARAFETAVMQSVVQLNSQNVAR